MNYKFLFIFVLSTLYIFFYQLSFDISVDPNFYSSDDKLWAHRVLSPSDAKSLSQEFNGVEIDVFFNSKLVYRFFAGIGIPNNNQREALPFEKSFFSGGSNGMRAWKVRSLGPGGYLDSSERFDKIGDIKLESNIETRFPISDLIEGAVFIDIGNVWLLRYDSLRAEGQFKWNTFVDQIAFGGGIGIRLNLDFFIIRADIAIPLKNPTSSIWGNGCGL